MATIREQPRGLIPSISLGEPIDIVLGLTAAALTGDQLLKARSSHEHKTAHLAKAGIGAAVTVGALAMLRADHNDKQHRHSREHSTERREVVPGGRSRRGSDATRNGRPQLMPRARTDAEAMEIRRGRRSLDVEDDRRGRRYGNNLLPQAAAERPRRDRSADERLQPDRRSRSRGRPVEDDRGLGSKLAGKFRSHSAQPPKYNDQHLTVDTNGQVYGLNASYYFPDMAHRYERR
jgi:hypothetical protein